MSQPEPWWWDAACQGKHELFDEVDEALVQRTRTAEEKRRARNVIAEAKAICAGCPVRSECELDTVPPYTPKRESSYSIRAGKEHTSFHPNHMPDHVRYVACPDCHEKVHPLGLQRHKYGHRNLVKEHGTWTGYQHHLRRGEKPCYDCREACRLKSKARRAEARAARKLSV